MKFRIEHIAQSIPSAYVLARQLEAGDFHLTEKPRLGGVSIKQHVSMPRSLGPDGKPDMTVFAFTPALADDLQLLSPGQIVELEV